MQNTETVPSNNTPSIAPVEAAIRRYYPTLLPACKCSLVVTAALAFKGRTKPLAVNFETPSGFGKSAITQLLFPRDRICEMNKYVYRSDKFSPRSFVSHVTGKSDEKMKEIDLLPKLNNKVLVIKELSPLFRGREEEMRENFSTLIAVLDGKGYMSNSGVHGQRGYDADIVFNWLGATTPLPASTHKLMSQLGTRMLFYETPNAEPSVDELLKYAAQNTANEAETECQLAVNAFMEEFFRVHPVGAVDANLITIPERQLKRIVLFARFLTYGRREIDFEKDSGDWTPVSAKPAEGAWKVINYFKELAQAHALIHGRYEVTDDDIALVDHVAESSIPYHLRFILRAMRTTGRITSTEYTKRQRIAKSTALRHFSELEMTGLVVRTKGDTVLNEPDSLEMVPEFSWFAETQPEHCASCSDADSTEAALRGARA